MIQEEKDSLDPGSANNMRVTPALVQLSPGGENTKELPDKTNFTGESKVYAVNSRRPNDDVASKGYTHHQAEQAEQDPTMGCCPKNKRAHSLWLK